MKQLALVLVAVSIALALLASNLRPDAFFVGDPGVKLIATRAALRTPSTPLDIPLPRIGRDAVPHVEPFFAVHDNTHAHAVTSEAFPLLSAPLLAMLGLRGLYVLPALGVVATLAACAWLGFVLVGMWLGRGPSTAPDGHRRLAIVGGVALVATETAG